MSLTLVQRIFIAFTVLLLLIALAAGSIIYFRGQEITSSAVNTQLENIRIIQQGFEQKRFQQLGLISEIFASDPYFSSYVAEATGIGLGLTRGDIDTNSMTDQLIQRQKDLGFDFAKVLNEYGEIIAHTEDPELIGFDLSSETLVSKSLDTLKLVTGYWFLNDEIYQIAIVPLSENETLVGFLLTALYVDNNYVNDIKKISGADLAIFSYKENHITPIISTLPESQIRDIVETKDSIIKSIDKKAITIMLGNEAWLAKVSNISDQDSSGLSIALTSVDKAAANFRDINSLMLYVMIIALILAIPLSLVISRKILFPVKKLAMAAIDAAHGNYNQKFERTNNNDEISNLTASFETLLSDLREKDDMQNYMLDLAKYLPDVIDSSGKNININSHELKDVGKFTLLGVELRRFNKETTSLPPEEVFSLLSSNINILTDLAKAYGGQVTSVMGQRVLIMFDDEQEGFKKALYMAGKILSLLSNRGEGVAIAVTEEHAIFGAIEVSNRQVGNVLGKGISQLNRLLDEAKSGYILITPYIYERVKTEEGHSKPKKVEGLISSKTYLCYSPEDVQAFDIEIEAETIQGTQVTLGGTKNVERMHIVPGMSLGGRFDIIAELGSGAMGVVYKAHDFELDDLVALKMLKLSNDNHAAELLDALKTEIRLARKITHPAVLRTFDYGELNGIPYISMEYVRGLTLKYLIEQKNSIPYSAAIRICKQVTSGLIAAHQEEILHRDIKPENIILEHNGNAKIMDFGIAKMNEGRVSPDDELSAIGTPRYAAPEQLNGQIVDPRSDIYSLGVLMFYMFTGSYPYSARSLRRLIKVKNTEDPTPASKYWKEIPDDLETVIMTCIARNPDERFSSAQELHDALEKLYS